MAFQYIALTPDGQRRSGRIEAETRTEALARIGDLGHQPVQLRVEETEAPVSAPSHRSQRRAQIVSATVYPAVLLFVACSTLVFLLTFVVPRLSGVFSDLGAELPLPTRMLLAITGALTSGWWAILGSGALIWFGLQAYRR